MKKRIRNVQYESGETREGRGKLAARHHVTDEELVRGEDEEPDDVRERRCIGRRGSFHRDQVSDLELWGGLSCRWLGQTTPAGRYRGPEIPAGIRVAASPGVAEKLRAELARYLCILVSSLVAERCRERASTYAVLLDSLTLPARRELVVVV